MQRISDYAYIFATLLFTVYGQLILKWRIQKFGPLPSGFLEKINFIIHLMMDPAIFSGFVAAFLASMAWMAAMTKFQLSHAYPFMSLNFVLVLLLSGWLLNEQITILKMAGVAIIVLGTIITAQG
jgi:uncharacterized membrane protein